VSVCVYPVKFFEENKRSGFNWGLPREMRSIFHWGVSACPVKFFEKDSGADLTKVAKKKYKKRISLGQPAKSYHTMTKQKQIYLIYVLILGAFIACYYQTFWWLHYKYSQQDSYYSHGYLIPLITAFLIYTKRDILRTIKPSTDIIGLIILIFALLLHIFATMGDVNFLSGFAMFFYIIGSSLYLFGRKISKEIAFPLVFLIFMFPIPSNFLNVVGLPSKSLATTTGLKIIDIMNIPYFREGFKINLEHTSLVVGTPCNGMKSIISFLALGLLFLYFTNIKVWMRFVIMVFIFPLAFFLNGARIAALIYIANNYGIEKASPESYLHTLSGMAVFIIGLVALVLFIRISEGKKSD
jgi:exosortase